eukprot:scaffold4408_cov209-Alexandrium_tamarense.AAC.3
MVAHNPTSQPQSSSSTTHHQRPDTADTSSSSPTIPLLSILNVVVDHVMMPPSPMEPMEFREVCRWNNNGNSDDVGDVGGGVAADGKTCADVHDDAVSSHPSHQPRRKLQVELFRLSPDDPDPIKADTSKPNNYTTANNESNPVTTTTTDDEFNKDSTSPPSFLSNEMQSIGRNIHKNLCIRVPVLRIFGAVLRDGNVGYYHRSHAGEDEVIGVGGSQKSMNSS